MSMVRVKESCIVHFQGMPVVLKADEPHDTSEPIVREFPFMFAADVEEATARPGERRNARRPE